MKVFMMMCSTMNGSVTLTDELVFIADDWDNWTNDRLPCGLDL